MLSRGESRNQTEYFKTKIFGLLLKMETCIRYQNIANLRMMGTKTVLHYRKHVYLGRREQMQFIHCCKLMNWKRTGINPPHSLPSAHFIEAHRYNPIPTNEFTPSKLLLHLFQFIQKSRLALIFFLQRSKQIFGTCPAACLVIHVDLLTYRFVFTSIPC